jgi:hypothetical protein
MVSLNSPFRPEEAPKAPAFTVAPVSGSDVAESVILPLTVAFWALSVQESSTRERRMQFLMICFQ